MVTIGFEHSKTKTLLGSPRSFRWLGWWTFCLLALSIVALVFVPWQQTVIGVGKVTVFSPMDRPQSIESQISGRLQTWYVNEGQMVQKGELIAKLADLDPKFLDTRQLDALDSQRKALNARRAATIIRIGALEGQSMALMQSRQAAVPGAGQKIFQNRDRNLVAAQTLTAAQQALEAANLNYKRILALHQKGLRSQRDLELARLDQVRSATGVEQAQAQLNLSQREVVVSQLDQSKVVGDTAAALASVASAIAAAQESLASVTSDIAKLSIEIENLKQRIQQRRIVSPVTGRVVRLLPVGAGETVSEGDVLATVVPKTKDQAVALYISDWDAPLVSEGRPVRLQFSGWPAIQFSGWPMIATGTFGGRVAVVDAVDDGMGRYRVLVKPDFKAIQNKKDVAWPDSSHLRPGTEATGWIMLETVPLGYELWRQFNAFPPTLKEKPEPSQQAPTKDKEKPVKRKKMKG
ncbi:MAG: biotin/lipoyl-binding protein [Vampirovibrionales bacterium]|nr:biotin/lipoyl-binding protein [Vampirovibrionales bacterium]